MREASPEQPTGKLSSSFSPLSTPNSSYSYSFRGLLGLPLSFPVRYAWLSKVLSSCQRNCRVEYKAA